MSLTAKEWWLNNNKGKPKLAISQHTPDPLKPGQLLIQNAYAAINYKDALSVTGSAKISRLSTIIPGQDLSGTVIKSSSPHFNIGDQVMSFGGGLGETLNGTFSELTVINAQQAIKIPAHWDMKMAAAFGTAGFTAALAIEKLRWNRCFHDVLPALVTGASGGVGLHALLLFNAYKQSVDYSAENRGIQYLMYSILIRVSPQ